MHIYEVRPRRDKRGFDLISDALPFGRLWYGLAQDAVGYAKFYSRSHAMIVRIFDESGGLIKTHESQSAFREMAVFGIPDPKWGEIVKACVVLKPGKTLTADELIAYCRRSLANFKAQSHREGTRNLTELKLSQMDTKQIAATSSPTCSSGFPV